eukprot:TRINITY_DN1058_c0_g1_i3.p1 TRINITY_DN1058_c0_g1~~TRINITY_DN1058_c0_g1_i3.p1  ORF type:complete len:655 (-),score=60.14 TRINITY_DN1058_c0_g1_i3:452-2416(-)
MAVVLSVPSMATNALPLVCVGALSVALSLVLYFRHGIDRYFHAFLAPKDPMIAERYQQKIEQSNEVARKFWLFLTLLTVSSLWKSMDLVGAAYGLIILPLSWAATSSSANRKYGWIAFIAHFTWLITRLALPNHVLAPETRLFFATFGLFSWTEISTTRPSTLLVRHILTIMAVALLYEAQGISCPIASVACLCCFCYRRSFAWSAEPKLTINPTLETAGARIGTLVRLVLEGGDELCADSRQILHEVVSLSTRDFDAFVPNEFTKAWQGEDGTQLLSLQQSPPFFLDDRSSPPTCAQPGSLSSSGLGVGTGDGRNPEPVLGGTTIRFPPAVVEDDDDTRGSMAEQGLALLSGVALEPRSEALPRSTVTHAEHTRHPGNKPSTSHFERGPRDAYDTQSMRAPGGSAAPEPSTHSHHNANRLPFAEELANMSFDAMAQVQLDSGTVLWGNQSFVELTHLAGGGSPLIGLQCLTATFLQQLPSKLCYLHSSIGVGASSVDLWSATQLVGPPNREIVLWAMHRTLTPLYNKTPAWPTSSVPRQASSQYRQQPPLSEQTEMHAPSSGSPKLSAGLSLSAALSGGNSSLAHPDQESTNDGFPKASEHTDLAAKIVCDPESFVTGRGRRQVQMLWRKYGERTLYTHSALEGRRCVHAWLC